MQPETLCPSSDGGARLLALVGRRSVLGLGIVVHMTTLDIVEGGSGGSARLSAGIAYVDGLCDLLEVRLLHS